MDEARGNSGPKAQKPEITVTKVELTAEETQGQVGDSCLIVFYGDNIGRRYFLNRPELILGRADSAHVQINQDSVSRNHAKVVVRPGQQPKVVDLESTNGTFVNNTRVTERTLMDGDLLRVGQTIFKHLSGSNIENKYHEEIYRLTTIDGLTECYNKRYFIDALEREVNRAVRYKRLLSLAMLDIDHFKKVNDTYGHLAGDYVLRELARLLSASVRRQDIFARYGGEEFAAIIPEVDGAGARVVCEKMRSLVEQYPFVYNGQALKVTISLGIETFDGQTEDIQGFIARADAKLYAAKVAGRNQICA